MQNRPALIFAHEFFAFAVWICDSKLFKSDFLAPQPAFCADDFFAQNVFDSLTAYFQNAEPLPIFPMIESKISPFQKRLRAELLQIPLGKTMTYGALAQKMGTSARGLGQALRANALPLFVPCHRVVASADLGGFHGRPNIFFKKIKAFLIDYERQNSRIGCR